MTLPPEYINRLYLLRHAEAGWPQNGQNDHQRPLTDHGQQVARKVGAFMAQQEIQPDCVWISSACRTQETFDHMLAGGMARPAYVTVSDSLYLCGRDGLVDFIEEHGTQHRAILIVNHNPDVPNLAEWLCRSSARPALHGANMVNPFYDFSPGSLAIIDGGRWDQLSAGWGRLVSVIAGD